MLFSSYEFILMFLPVTLLVYYWLGMQHQFRVAIAWLVACSLFFYGWWNPAYLGLIIASIFFNYSLGVTLSGQSRSKALLVVGIAANLALLGYFKYTNFFIDNLNALFGTRVYVQDIILPLAISFFTFQQIAYLVDAYRGETREYNFMQYTLFVTFFPQLIAGPIVHHREMLPQFTRHITEQVNAANLMAGSVIFFIGLFKKVMVADNIAQFSTPVFTAVEHGMQPTLFEAWGAALAYSLQLYFDFSGYADMAIGISLMFGIRLPLNFDSPYKSTSIIDFWRRWHMTLSRFLRDYLYIPLGGNRKGEFRRYINLAVTMLLGGLWHGAGWTFVIWGGLHGLYLVVNHLWRSLCSKVGLGQGRSTFAGRLLAGSITFIAVVVAWVFFRAESFHGAMAVLNGMVGNHGVTLPIKYEERWGDFAMQLKGWGVLFDDNLFQGNKQLAQTLIWLLVAWFMPNCQTLMRNYEVTTDKVTDTSRIVFKPNLAWLLFIYLLAVVSILNLGGVSEFLYFQF
ncbi:MAG: MBOAT family protein [Gammaproteobacteria bacterium]|nr:MAG: MBOAT family protein [Gammaproteobacteria bacterium]